MKLNATLDELIEIAEATISHKQHLMGCVMLKDSVTSLRNQVVELRETITEMKNAQQSML